ncbi:MAG: ATP-binding protein, partial [Anaerovibrio sp.]|uniref:ATP-binding protein n=1 Tax=Anaerovibrio sp. TaxID=1872532 RepID=UPI0025D011BB
KKGTKEWKPKDGFEFEKYVYFVSFREVTDASAKSNGNVKGQAKALALEGQVKRQTKKQVGDNFDYTLGGMKKIQKPEFLADKLTQFSLDKDVKEYLSQSEKNKIRDGQYIGAYNDLKALKDAMDWYYDVLEEKTNFDEEKWGEYFSESLVEKKHLLLMAQAKLISLYLIEHPNETTQGYDKDEMYRLLYEYAHDRIRDNEKMSEGEQLCYADSICSNSSLPIEQRMIVAEMCLASYYSDGLSGYLKIAEEDDDAKKRFFHKNKCLEPARKSILRMMFNFPEEVFLELLEKYEDVAYILSSALWHEKDQSLNRIKHHIKNKYIGWNTTKKQFCEKLEDLPQDIKKVAESYRVNYRDNGEALSKYLFDMEQQLIKELDKLLKSVLDNTDTESAIEQNEVLTNNYSKCNEMLKTINNSPTKFGFEEIKPFIERIQENMVKYLNELYHNNKPEINVEHYSLMDNKATEILCISNAERRLRAENVSVISKPHRGTRGFAIDKNRKVDYESKVSPGETSEISVPILIKEQDVSQLELIVKVTYDYLDHFDPSLGKGILASQAGKKDFQITIKLSDDEDFIEKNLYKDFAGGNDMSWDDRKMFFGRDDIINGLYNEIIRPDGSINSGKMLGFYGQKRSGKTSILNFLKHKIEDENPQAIVSKVNLQTMGYETADPEYFMKELLYNICYDFKEKIEDSSNDGDEDIFDELRYKLAENSLIIPGEELLESPSAKRKFINFFKRLKRLVGKKYPVIVMLDEFTSVYFYLVEKRIPRDFLNQWRSVVTEAGFCNVLVGQDFLPELLNSDIAKLTDGNAVNGLATTDLRAVSYLDENEAYKMMENPILKRDKQSRFHGELGKAAKKMIFELTGGSAFYLMKFMNGLVDYMCDNDNEYVTPNLIKKVVIDYIFDSQEQYLKKDDFDPIYNQYSSSLSDNWREELSSDEINGKMDLVYSIFREIARASDDYSGICKLEEIDWNNREELNYIIDVLKKRYILVDENGKDIPNKELKGLRFKVKVGLFVKYLKQCEINN